ncbi:TRPT1, partial [Symbiodinium microadriaticum]
MGRAHYRPDGTRRRTSGELAARAKKKARREQEAAEAAAAPPVEAEPGPVWPDRRDDVEEAEVEIEVEVEEVVEEPPVRHRPKVRLRPAPKWGAASPDDRAGPRARSRSPYRVTVSAERLFRLSKALTRLLRHKAAEEGLPLRADGFFNVEAIIQTSEMRSHGARSAEILHAIQQDAKKRYTLRHFDGVPWVRAAQGHSQSVSKDLLMRKLRRQELPPYLYHGTRAGNYRSILRSGLLAGGPSGCRTDIHLVEHLPAMMPMLDLPRYKAVKELHHGRVPQVLRTTAGWPMDWPVGPLNLVSFSTGTLLADIHASKFCPCRFSPGRVASNSECAAHWWPLRGASRTTAPLGAVSSHMSYTPNSEASLLWSPNDESEDFPPSPAPAAPTASTAPARETPAVGTPVGSLLGRALRRGHYAPEILRVVEHVLDPVRPSQVNWADNEAAESSFRF